MWSGKRHILVCSIIYLYSFRFAFSQNIDLQDVLRRNVNYFSNITCLSFTGTEVDVLQVPGPDLGKKVIKKITFLESGTKFSFRVEGSSEILGSYFSYSAAYNGEYFQTFRGTTLSLQKGIPHQLPSLDQVIYFIMPFDFVRAAVATIPEHRSEVAFVLTPDQFNQPKNWKLLQGCIKTASIGSLQGKQGLIVRISGRLWGDDMSMSVLFDPTQNDYPVAWERVLTKDKDWRNTYVINEVGKVTAGKMLLSYPKKALYTQYFSTNKPLPSVISTISIDQISINEPIKGNDPFTIVLTTS
jgi:hypothetical protein